MASRAIIDGRGRVQIPRADREKASIPPNSQVMVIPRSPGHLELVLVGGARLERFQKQIRGKLKDWKEKENKADRQLLKETAAGPHPYRLRTHGNSKKTTQDTPEA